MTGIILELMNDQNDTFACVAVLFPLAPFLHVNLHL